MFGKTLMKSVLTLWCQYIYLGKLLRYHCNPKSSICAQRTFLTKKKYIIGIMLCIISFFHFQFVFFLEKEVENWILLTSMPRNTETPAIDRNTKIPEEWDAVIYDISNVLENKNSKNHTSGKFTTNLS